MQMMQGGGGLGAAPVHHEPVYQPQPQVYQAAPVYQPQPQVYQAAPVYQPQPQVYQAAPVYQPQPAPAYGRMKGGKKMSELLFVWLPDFICSFVFIIVRRWSLILPFGLLSLVINGCISFDFCFYFS